jgi:predicted ester cyclase
MAAMPPTPDAVLRQWFQEVWNEQNESAIDRLMAPDAVAHGLGPEPVRGPEAFKAFWHAFRGALSDLRIDVVHTATDGDMVVAHCHVTGRHTGPTLGGKATGREVDFWGFTRGRVVDGQIVEGWNTFDFLAFYQQLGWVQNPVV